VPGLGLGFFAGMTTLTPPSRSPRRGARLPAGAFASAPAFPSAPTPVSVWGETRARWRHLQAPAGPLTFNTDGRLIRPGPLGWMEDAQLDGLLAESAFEAEARNDREPLAVLAYIGGTERRVTAAEEPRIAGSEARMRWKVERCARALFAQLVAVRGARWSCRFGDPAQMISVDLPLHVGVCRRGDIRAWRKALVELKYCPWHVGVAARPGAGAGGWRPRCSGRVSSYF
jgi:hypothetical protein